MSKSSKKKQNAGAETAGKVNAQSLSEKDSGVFRQRKSALKSKNRVYYLAASVSLITFLVYLKSLQNGFVNWDDPLYVLENPHVRTLGLSFFKWAFSDFYAANWHPLTWISHALDYALWGLNPLGHHLTNNFLHAVNTFLVVVLVAKLLGVTDTRSSTSSPSPTPPTGGGATSAQGGITLDKRILIAAATTGLLFGLHPLHVESAAWVSERKDLLCAMFFLLSISSYMSYKSYRTYFLCLAFFSLALLSKPMAVTLPAVLLILDWYPLGRIGSWKSLGIAILRKIPFLALSLISSVLTVMAQKAGSAMGLMETVPLSSRLLVAAESLIAYLGKMLWPVNLIAFYPYPKDVSLSSPAVMLSIVLLIGITAACVMAVKNRRIFLASWGFYIVTMLPVLGIIQVGGQAMADRYAYLPSIAPFLLAGLAAGFASRGEREGERGLMPQAVAAVAAAVVILSLSYLTFRQIQVWESSHTLWTHAIEKAPDQASVAYKNRGLFFYETGLFDRAIEDYTRAIDLDPSYVHAYNNRGLSFVKTGRLDMAFADYNKALTLQPSYRDAYTNRGLAFDLAGRLDEAIADYNKALALNPSDYIVYNYRGIAFDKGGLSEKAVADYDAALALNPFFAQAYKNRAAAFLRMGKRDKAVADYDAVFALNPSDYNEYVSLGAAYGGMGLFDKAIECFTRAIALRPDEPRAYNDRGFTYFLAKQYDRALQDFNTAVALNRNNVLVYVNRGNLYLEKGDKELAIADFQTACNLGAQEGCRMLRSVQR